MYRIYNLETKETFLFQDEAKGTQEAAIYFDKERAYDMCDMLCEMAGRCLYGVEVML